MFKKIQNKYINLDNVKEIYETRIEWHDGPVLSVWYVGDEEPTAFYFEKGTDVKSIIQDLLDIKND